MKTTCTRSYKLKVYANRDKTETEAIQFWEVIVKQTEEGFGLVETVYGQLGTDKPQTTRDIIRKGKNIGKKNEP